MSVTVRFEISDEAYRTLLPFMQNRRVQRHQLGRQLMEQLAANVAAGKVPVRYTRPPKFVRPQIPKRPAASEQNRRRELTHEEQQQLQQLYVEHELRANMVAAIMGVSVSTVTRYVGLLELPRHPRGTTPTAVLERYERMTA